MNSDIEYFSISQAAKYLGISEDTLRRWERQGKLVPGRTLGNFRRYLNTDLDQIKQNTQQISFANNFERLSNKIDKIANLLSKENNNFNIKSLSNEQIQAPNVQKGSFTSEEIIDPANLSENKTNNTIHKLMYDSMSKIYNVYKYISPTIILLILILISSIIAIVLLFNLNKWMLEQKNSNKVADQKISEIIPELKDSLIKANKVVVGNNAVVLDEFGNISLSGVVSGGYIDLDNNNLIVNSGFEQNDNGKALFYIYEQGANEKNVFISQDSSFDGKNALKIISSDTESYRIIPSYQTLQSGKTYTFSFMVKSLGIDKATLTFGYGDNAKKMEIEDNVDWHLLSFTKSFKNTDSPDAASFFIEISESSRGSIYLDNLMLVSGTMVSNYKANTLITDGIFMVEKDTLFPVLPDTGSIGTISKPFNEMIVNNQTINDALTVLGSAEISGDLIIDGTFENDTITTNKLLVQNDGLYTGTGVGTKRLDSTGNLINIANLGLAYGTLSSATDYLISSVGLSVGGNSNYYFNKNGYIKTAQLNSVDDIKIGDPSGETDSLGIYFTGVSGHSNEAGFRFNTSSGKLEYRDENSSSWIAFDSLSSSSTNIYSASNGVYLDNTDFQLGGSLNSDTTIDLSSYDMVYNLSSTGDFEIKDNDTTLVYISDSGYIGIGTDSPGFGLDVASYTNFSSSVNIASTLTTAALIITGGATDGYVLTSDATGNASWQTITGDSEYTASNGLNLSTTELKLGGTLTEATTIHQDTFGFTLDNNGTANTIFNLGFDGDFIIEDNGTAFATFANNGSFTLDNIILDNNVLSAATANGLGLYDDGGSGIFIKDGGNVGIGTTNPTSRLSIKGSSDAIQLDIQANTNQSNTNPLIVLRNSAGSELLRVHSDHEYNTFLGSFAGNANMQGVDTDSSGKYNTFLGSYTGYRNTSGQGNSAIGMAALLNNTTGDSNLAIGYNALNLNVEGSENLALGTSALAKNVVGEYNTAIGNNALFMTTGGLGNIAIGNSGQYFNIDGKLNVSLGNFSLYQNMSGNNNTAIGFYAGGATAGSGNVFLGYSSGSNEVGSNKLYIENSDSASPLIWGDFETDILNINGSLGIGTTDPIEKLEVAGNIRVTGGSFIDDGTTLDVPDYVFEENYKLMSLSDLNQYITTYKHLPNVPDMNDRAGWAALSLQDRDMKLLEKIEENVLYQLDLNSKVNNLSLALDSKTTVTNSEILSNTGELFIQAEIYDGLLENLDENKLEILTVMITDSLGDTKVAVGAFGKIFSASLIAGYANIKNLVSDTLLARQVRVEEKLLSPIVESEQILTDQLAARQLTAQDATISGTLSAKKAVFGDSTMEQSNNGTIALEVLGDASISGELIADSARVKTLIADKVKAASIEGLETKIGDMVAASVSAQLIALSSSSDTEEASDSSSPNLGEVGWGIPSLPENWEQSLDDLIARLDNVETATASGSWSTLANLNYDSQLLTGALDTDFAMVNTYLGVLGTASIVDLQITNTLTVQDSLSLTASSISTLSDTLYLQPNGLGKVDILAGAVTVESNGTLRVNGDLYLKGNLYAQGIITEGLNTKTATVSGSLFANLIETNGSNLALELGGVNGASDSASLNSKFQILNSGQEVASIDASGSGRFKAITASKLYLPYTYDIIGNSIDSSISTEQLSQTADSIGMGTIKAGETEAFIQAPTISKDSLVFLTPTTTTMTPLAVSSKEIDSGFTVSLVLPETENVSFNWWIIN